jgi:hypothetical protein
MAKLYIIGNGFDLWHGLPTSYDCFYRFAKADLDELESYYHIDTTKAGPWCDFEKSLGTFDWSLFYEAHDNTDVTAEDFRPSAAFGLEDDLTEQADAFVENIRKRFHEWIAEIDISTVSAMMRLSPHDLFLTFNYTSTLQSVYGIDDERVLHIHGKSDRFDNLVFGHAETMEEEPEMDENGDSNRTMFSDAEGRAKYPFYALQKPVDEVIEKYRGNFESLQGVNDVTVIGHSLNEIDLPYFDELAKSIMRVRWLVCCYRAEEKAHFVQQLLKCGIRREDIDMCAYNDIEANL